MSTSGTTFEERLLAVVVEDLLDRPRTVPSSRTRSRRYAPLALIAAVAILLVLAITAGSPNGVTTVTVESTSMEPTLTPGEVVSVRTDAYDTSLPARGDIVAFRRPDFPDQVSFLRVIGLPGDTITETGGVVAVNGVTLDEPYAHLDHLSGAWHVEPGHVFLMGDNRGSANDSRLDGSPGALGQVPIDAVIGQVAGEATGAADVPAGPAAVFPSDG